MKFISKSFVTLTAILWICFTANAQDKWTTYETENKEFSISFPKDITYFIDQESILIHKIINNKIELQNFRSLTSYQNGVSMWMEIFDVEDGKKAFPHYLSWVGTQGGKIKDYKFDDFFLRQIIKENENFNTTLYHFHSKNKIYTIGAASKEKNNKTIAHLLTTVKFNGKSIFSSSVVKTDIPADKIILEKLSATPFEINYLENDKTVKSDKINSNDTDSLNKNFSDEMSDQNNIVFLFKALPKYTEEARQNNYTGKVLLNVFFGSNGQIRRIDVIKGLKYGLTEATIKAARRIKFLPAERNDEPINVVKQIPYGFTIY